MRKDKNEHATRWKVLALINLCLIIICCAVFGANAMIARADTSATASLSQDSDHAAAEDWYAVEDGGERLSINLKNQIGGYTWKYGTSNEILRQMHGFELREDETNQINPDEWTLYMVPREDGEVVITFVYIKDADSDSIDTRTLKVRVKDGKITIIG